MRERALPTLAPFEVRRRAKRVPVPVMVAVGVLSMGDRPTELTKALD
jgi:hypothetical protein